MKNINRRQFIKSAGVSAAATAAVAGPRISFAASDDFSKSILVFIFLRGGIDGLSVVTPMDGHPDRVNYDQLRVNGTNIPSSLLLPLSGNWGLHPAATGLHDLWNSGDLAIVQAVGLPFANRSHFEAERYVELGTPGNRFTIDGWLTRHLQSATNLPNEIVLPAVVTESFVSFSLLNEPTAVTLGNPGVFDLETNGNSFEEEQEAALADIYALDSTSLNVAGVEALNALELVEQIDFSNYVPDNGAQYPTRPNDPSRITDFAGELQIIAQLIKEDSGVRIAQADRGGWDTHANQDNLIPNSTLGGESFFDKLKDVSDSIKAFFTDMEVASPDGDNWSERITMVVYSEFGRRAFDNDPDDDDDRSGTDHGYANNMLVLGKDVNGGRLFGSWPGLGDGQLFQNADVMATTDYRTVLSEILIKRLHNNKLFEIFPGYTEEEYTPLGVVNGSQLHPDFNNPDIIFKDGSE